MSDHSPVLIIGGGPVGLATGYVLGRHGVRSIICEKFPSIHPHPRAHVVNTRSMELFRGWGIADRVIADGLDASWLTSFVWRTTVAGEDLGRIDLTLLPEDDIVRRMLASAEGLVSCAQDRVQRHLLDAVLEQSMVELRQPARVTALEVGGDVVTATVERDGTEEIITADYVVGADGALSWTREQLGVRMQGMPPIGQQINVYFHADLSDLLGDRPSVLTWLINSESSGVLIAMDGDRRWTFNLEYNPAIESIDDYPPQRCVELLRAAIGADVEVDVQSVGTWTMSVETARTYRIGRVFLAGDAAHRFPPTGGLGMNTGIVDADNLAWKLAAVIDGWASAELLDTYEQERKPVALRNAQQSVTNALGMAGTGLGPNGAKVAAALESDDPAVAAAERERLRSEIDRQLTHVDALNLELGYRYTSSPIITDDGSPRYVPADPARDFRPDAQPGARLPHVVLERAGETISTLDLVGADFLLIAGPGGSPWITSVGELDGSVPLRAVQLGVDLIDPAGDFLGIAGIDEHGCVLVRPDGHVTFRAPTAADDPTATLADAVDRAIARTITRVEARPDRAEAGTLRA